MSSSFSALSGYSYQPDKCLQLAKFCLLSVASEIVLSSG